VKIFASSSLDEYEIYRLVSAGVPINGFGVGRFLATSSDTPALDMAYKLSEYAGRPKMKLSESKTTLPGRKQIFRQYAEARAVGDVIGLMGENAAGDPLLAKYMENGRRIQAAEPLEACRERCKSQRASLEDSLMSLSKVDPGYPVKLSADLKAVQAAILEKNRK
jgi:nicotinate phosphoribosyltransferase